LKRRKEEEELIRTIGEAENRKRAISPFVYKSSLYRNSTYCSGSPFTRKI
jgi:small subunit ribosomal protein S4